MFVILLNIKFIDIVSQENVNEATKVLDTALEKISLKDLNYSALKRLQKAVEASGQKFKYEILPETTKVFIINYKYNYLLF